MIKNLKWLAVAKNYTFHQWLVANFYPLSQTVVIFRVLQVVAKKIILRPTDILTNRQVVPCIFFLVTKQIITQGVGHYLINVKGSTSYNHQNVKSVLTVFVAAMFMLSTKGS